LVSVLVLERDGCALIQAFEVLVW